MSDTTIQDCNCCNIEDDCIDGLCQSCNDYNYKLQKQVDLLTLGLLQEKSKSKNLEVACKLAQHELLKITTDSYALAAIKQALPKPVGKEMADAFDKIVEPTENSTA